MSERLTDREIEELKIRADAGDSEARNALIDELVVRVKGEDSDPDKVNEAWLMLYDLVIYYIRTLAQWNEDLVGGGWIGFLNAMKSYKPEKGKFITYATQYIERGISDERKILFPSTKQIETSDKENDKLKIELETLPEAEDKGGYSARRRLLQLIEVLRLYSDEKHTLNKQELGRLLSLYRRVVYQNGTKIEWANTITDDMVEMIAELDPEEYSEENKDLYRIRYSGYKENRLKKIQEKKEKLSKEDKEITGFSYVYPFLHSELDQMIGLICFSDMITEEEKNVLIRKLVRTTSLYYKSPFWDGEKLRFNPKAVSGRFGGRHGATRAKFAENLKRVQEAINRSAQIRFWFNRYTEDHRLEHTSEHMHILSPYHLVVYHDNIYCIGLKQRNGKGEERIWHYRLDLMSDIEMIRDEKGKIVPIEVCRAEKLPIFDDSWDPEKYMSEHLYMGYGDPRDIRIKVKKKDTTIYTALQDWFGDHFRKNTMHEDEEHDIIWVKTSPGMLVHWAMQYGTRVEILDEEVREKIREEVRKMREMYGD